MYAKTARGRDEVAQRSLGLSSRQRTVLILLDGRKPCSALTGLMPLAQVEAIAGELLALGLVETCGQPVVSAEASARLAEVKAEMRAIAERCLGLLAAEVVRRIERAADDRELLGVVGHWHMALQASKLGREAALAHVERIKDSLQGLAAA